MGLIIKLLLLAGFFYVGYKVYRVWRTINMALKKAVSGTNPMQVDDEMVKDPFCGVYFPLREGRSLMVNGKTEYFCSDKCRDEFIASRGKE